MYNDFANERIMLRRCAADGFLKSADPLPDFRHKPVFQNGSTAPVDRKRQIKAASLKG